MSETSVGEICLDLVVNQNKFNKQMTGIQSLAKKTGVVLAAAFGVKKIVSFGKECTKLGSDLQEVQNVVDVTFPNMTEKVNTFSRSAASSFGLSETMAKKFTGTFGTMAKAFGFTEQQAYDMGSTLAGLAGDVASFYNITQDEAYTKLKSVFSGETETLKDLGVVMTQTALDSYALANGYGKTTKAMSEAEKVALRYAFVQDKLSAASGDFVRTSGGWANQVRVLTLQFDSLKATIGQGLINALTPVLKLINALISKIVSFAQALSDSLGKIFGWSYQSTGGGVATDLETGAESASGISNGLDNAAKSAKKLKQQLSGFDELNVITTNSDSPGSGNGGTSSNANIGDLSNSGWTKTEGLFDGFKEEIKSFEKLFQDIKIGDWFAVGQDVSNITSGIFNMFSNAIDRVEWFDLGQKMGNFIGGLNWGAILKSIGNLIWQSLKASIELWAGAFDAAPIETAIISAVGILKFTGIGSLITGAISAAIASSFGSTPIFTTISAAFQALCGNSAAQSALAMMFGGLFSNPIAWGIAGIAAGIPTMMVGLYDAIKQGIDWLNGALIAGGATLIGTGLGAIIGSALGGPGLGTAIGAAIGLWAGVVTDMFLLLHDNIDKFKQKFSGIVTWFDSNIVKPIKEIWGDVSDWFNEKVIQPTIDFFQGLGLRVEQIFEGLLIIVKAIWIIVSQWFNEKVVQPLVNIFQPIVEKIASFFSETWEKIKLGWSVVTGWFEEKVIQPFQRGWEIVSTKIKEIFSKLWTGIKKDAIGVMNSLLSIVESAINKMVNGINKIIKGFNKVVSWAAKVAEVNWGGVSTIPTVSLSRIPMLAEGGYVKANTPQLAIIGDNRHHGEIVSPEDKLDKMALKAAQLARSNEDNNYLIQMILLMKQQNELLTGILQKETGITRDDIGQNAREWAKEYYKRTGDDAFSF